LGWLQIQQRAVGAYRRRYQPWHSRSAVSSAPGGTTLIAAKRGTLGLAGGRAACNPLVYQCRNAFPHAQLTVFRAGLRLGAAAPGSVGRPHIPRGRLLARCDRPLSEAATLAARGISLAGSAAAAVRPQLFAQHSLRFPRRGNAQPRYETKRKDPRADGADGRLYQPRDHSVLAVRNRRAPP